jgi:hypothetical protein
MKEIIPRNKIYSYKIKLSHISSSFVNLGIVDRLAGKYNQCSLGQYYAILYCGSNGKIYQKSK